MNEQILTLRDLIKQLRNDYEETSYVTNEDAAFEEWWSQAFFNTDQMSLRDIAYIVWTCGWSEGASEAVKQDADRLEALVNNQLVIHVKEGLDTDADADFIYRHVIGRLPEEMP